MRCKILLTFKIAGLFKNSKGLGSLGFGQASVLCSQLLAWNLEQSCLHVSTHWTMNETEKEEKGSKQHRRRRLYGTLGTQQALRKCPLTLKRRAQTEGVRRQGEDSPMVESVTDLLLCELGPGLPFLLSEAGETTIIFFYKLYGPMQRYGGDREPRVTPGGHTATTETARDWTSLHSGSHSNPRCLDPIVGISWQTGIVGRIGKLWGIIGKPRDQRRRACLYKGKKGVRRGCFGQEYIGGHQKWWLFIC